MPSQKRSLDSPENPRPTKRVETTFPSPTGNVGTDNPGIPTISKVDIAIAKHLETYRLKRADYDNVGAYQKANMLSDIFSIIVKQSRGKLDPELRKMVNDDEYIDKWHAFAEAHPGLIDTLFECWSLDPPSFNKILELGALITKLFLST